MGDYRTTHGEPMPLTTKARKRRRLLVAAVLLASIAGIVYAGIAIKVQRYITATGYVTTKAYAEVRPAAAGTVANILVHSGETVEKGEILVLLESEEERAALEEAKRRVQKMQVDMQRRKAEIETLLERARISIEEQKRNHRDAINIAKLQLQDAQTKLKRTRELVERGLKAGSALEDDKLKEQLVQAQLSSLLAKDLSIYENLLLRDRSARQAELKGMEQEVNALQDVVKRLEARVRAKEIRAPIAGRVLRYEFVIGELVRPETVLFEIFGGDEQILKLRIAERYATKVAEGQHYSAVLASYAGLQKVYFTGTVQRLRNVIQAEGRKTYRVAYCDFDSQGYTIPPGTTANARIYYGYSCAWFYLFNIDT